MKHDVYTDYESMSADEKEQSDNLKKQIDYSIDMCVSGSKSGMQRAYDLRNGTRSSEKFKYLWEAYGLEFPGQLRHVPVLKSMFDVMVSQRMLTPLNKNITCRDAKSIDKIRQQKKLQILKKVNDLSFKNLSNRVNYAVEARNAPAGSMPQKPEDLLSEQNLDNIKEQQRTFKADLEIYGQHMLEYLCQRLRIKNIDNTILNDLISAGAGYYQCKVEQVGRKPLFRDINPLHLYYSKGPNVQWIRDCTRIVYEEVLPITEVLARYGHDMTADERKELYKLQNQTSTEEIMDAKYLGRDAGNDKEKHHIQNGLSVPHIKVYYVEWKANNRIDLGDEVRYKLDRYEGVRVGAKIYVEMGRSKFVQRSDDDPSYVPLSFNGLCIDDRNGDPLSMVLDTEDISDMIDILFYHQENLVGMSAGKAVEINFPDIPAFIEGDDEMQRLMKWAGLLKMGINVKDTSQDGAGAGKHQYSSQGTDLTLGNSAQSIQQMIDHLLDVASRITGISRQTIGAITQNDGKGTSEMAVQNSSLVTQRYFTTANEIMQAALSDLLNASRICYSKGFTGSYILGSLGQQVFTIDSKDFSLAEYDVFVSDGNEEKKSLEDLKSMSIEFVKAQMISIDSMIDMFTVTSLTELRERMIAAAKQSSGQQLQQLQSQLEQVTQQLKDAEARAAKNDEVQQQIDSQRLQLEAEKIALDREDRQASRAETRRLNSANIDDDAKRTDLEAMQIEYAAQADEVKDKPSSKAA